MIAFDLSLTCTGVAWAATEGFGTTTMPCKLRGAERLVTIRNRVIACLAGQRLPILIEALPPSGHTMGDKSGQAELHGVIRVALHEAGITPTYVQPASIKKYATGKGNAKKEVVLAEAIRRLGYAGSSTDEADALWMLAMGLDHAGRPLVPMPATHREALAKVEWAS